MPPLRVAVLHHWFVTQGGGERVAECIAALLPTADVFSLVHSEKTLPESLRDRPIRGSFLQRIPRAPELHRHMMPIYPEASKSIDLRAYDLVVSSDSGPVKGASVREGVPHLCYCHSPMRYLYDGYEEYRAAMPWMTRAVFTLTAPRVRRADLAAARRVTQFIANSQYVAERIRNHYGREADVIYPPIDLHRARRSEPGTAYLAAGRLVPYKRTELLIEACKLLGRSLRIAGTGPEMTKLLHLAGSETRFLGKLPTEELWNEYSRCRALLFAADEDFGMVALEAQSCGRPVIAFGHGGSLETVRGNPDDPRKTGVFFAEQNATSLAEAILRFEASQTSFRPEDSEAHAARFATPIFLERMRAEILGLVPAAEGVLASVQQAMAVVG